MPQLISFDGLKLYYESDSLESPSGIALIVHGFGDHCKRYEAFCELLNHCLTVLLTRFVTKADNGSSAGAAVELKGPCD